MLRFGLFGCGRIGRVHAESVASNPRAELAIAYDPFESATTETSPASTNAGSRSALPTCRS